MLSRTLVAGSYSVVKYTPAWKLSSGRAFTVDHTWYIYEGVIHMILIGGFPPCGDTANPLTWDLVPIFEPLGGKQQRRTATKKKSVPLIQHRHPCGLYTSFIALDVVGASCPTLSSVKKIIVFSYYVSRTKVEPRFLSPQFLKCRLVLYVVEGGERAGPTEKIGS